MSSAFNEEIKKTVDEVLNDEQTAAMIGEKVRACVNDAIKDAEGYAGEQNHLGEF